MPNPAILQRTNGQMGTGVTGVAAMFHFSFGGGRFPALPAALVLASLAAVACASAETALKGDAASSSEIQKITASDRVYALDDLRTAGFKKSKTYDVTGLEGATEAYYGFFGPDPYNRQDYEVRLYASHGDAVRLGIPMADDATGEGALLRKEDAVWKADLTERRECRGADDHSGLGGGHQVGRCDAPKYADYVVVGNLVLLCQGDKPEDSQRNCAALVAGLQ